MSKNKQFQDIYTYDKVVIYRDYDYRKIDDAHKAKVTKYTFERPNNFKPHSFIDAIFSYLNHFGFKKKVTATDELLHLKPFLEYLLGLGGKNRVFEPQILIDYANKIKKDGCSQNQYYTTFRMLDFSTKYPYAELDVELSEAKETLKELQIPAPKKVPQPTLTDIFGIQDGEKAKAVWLGFEAFIKHGWNNTQKYKEVIFETVSGEVAKRKLEIIKSKDGDKTQFQRRENKNLNNSAYALNYLLSKKPFYYEPFLALKDFPEKIDLSSNKQLSDFLLIEKEEYLRTVFLNEIGSGAEKQLKKGSFPSPIKDPFNTLYIIRFEYWYRPTKVEEDLVRCVLSKYKFTERMYRKMTLDDVTFNTTKAPKTSREIKTVQISEVKYRNGPKSKKARGVIEVFDDTTFEYKMIRKYVDDIDEAMRLNPDFNSKRKLFQTGFDLRGFDWLLKVILTCPSWQKGNVYKKAKPFIETWKEFEEFNKEYSILSDTRGNISNNQKALIQKYKKLGATVTNVKEFTRYHNRGIVAINPTAIFLSCDAYSNLNFKILGGLNNPTNIPIENELEAEIGAATRNHSLQTERDIYHPRNRSAIAVEAEHKAGRQIANQMVSDAIDLSEFMKNRTEVLTLPEIKGFLGIATDSELTEINHEAAFEELLDATGGVQLNQFFGIEQEVKGKLITLIVKSPVVLAAMKIFVEHIENEGKRIINEGLDIPTDEHGFNIPQVAVRWEAQRIMLEAIMKQKFDEKIHKDAVALIEKYGKDQICPLAPLI